MSDDSILKLFEGLTVAQVRELRAAILPILKIVRDAIVMRDEQKKENGNGNT